SRFHSFPTRRSSDLSLPRLLANSASSCAFSPPVFLRKVDAIPSKLQHDSEFQVHCRDVSTKAAQNSATRFHSRRRAKIRDDSARSEEHTSELQSPDH